MTKKQHYQPPTDPEKIIEELTESWIARGELQRQIQEMQTKENLLISALSAWFAVRRSVGDKH